MSRATRACAIALLIAACGSSPPPRVELPATKPAEIEKAKHYDPTANLPVSSTEVTWKADGHDVPATLTHPTAAGIYPALVLMAGSGPTDRDWNSPLLPNKNGSGKLLAEALAAHGMIVVRFDKAAIGANKAQLASITLDTYVAEIRGGLAFLRTRGDVDQAHMFIAGHSEGGLHAIRAAIAEGGRIDGLILLSSAGRSMRDIMLGQIQNQLSDAAKAGNYNPQLVKPQMDALKGAFDDFIEGRPVDPTAVSAIPAIQQLVTAVINPDTVKLTRDLLAYDPADGVGKLKMPVFIYNGLKDVQVDPVADASRLEEKIRAASGNVTLFLAPDANHVLKHESKSMADLRKDLASVQNGYNAPDGKLDATTMSAIGNWIAQRTTATAAAKPN